MRSYIKMGHFFLKTPDMSFPILFFVYQNNEKQFATLYPPELFSGFEGGLIVMFYTYLKKGRSIFFLPVFFLSSKIKNGF